MAIKTNYWPDDAEGHRKAKLKSLVKKDKITEATLKYIADRQDWQYDKKEKRILGDHGSWFWDLYDKFYGISIYGTPFNTKSLKEAAMWCGLSMVELFQPRKKSKEATYIYYDESGNELATLWINDKGKLASQHFNENLSKEKADFVHHKVIAVAIFDGVLKDEI